MDAQLDTIFGLPDTECIINVCASSWVYREHECIGFGSRFRNSEHHLTSMLREMGNGVVDTPTMQPIFIKCRQIRYIADSFGYYAKQITSLYMLFYQPHENILVFYILGEPQFEFIGNKEIFLICIAVGFCIHI